MILCCGEALIDMLPAHADDGRPALVPHVGGAVFNTAVALGRLGLPVGMLSGVSQDRFGQMLTAALASSRVRTDFLVRSDRLTTLAIVHLEDGMATYAFYDENSAGRMLRAADLPDLPSSINAFFLGGISLVNAPAADVFIDLVERERPGRVVMLDPNIRPAFAAGAHGYRKRLERAMALADILKVSEEDLEWLAPSGGTLQDHARALLQKGPRFVIVTRGEKGATAFSAGSQISVPAVPATCIDTVGAGDAFNAGVLARLQLDGKLHVAALSKMSAEELRAALDLGSLIAARTVARSGANPPWDRDVWPR